MAGGQSAKDIQRPSVLELNVINEQGNLEANLDTTLKNNGGSGLVEHHSTHMTKSEADVFSVKVNF